MAATAGGEPFDMPAAETGPTPATTESNRSLPDALPPEAGPLEAVRAFLSRLAFDPAARNIQRYCFFFS